MPGDRQSNEDSPRERVRVDEMMGRLQSRGESRGGRETEERSYDPETGEVRVKRRRRVKKLDSKARARKRRQRIFWVFFGVVTLFTAVVVSGYYLLWGGVRTDAFRAGAESVMASTFDQADVQAQLFQLDGSTLKSPKVSMVGQPGAMIQRADLASMSLELNRESFSNDDWLVDRISASELKLFVMPRGAASLKVDGNVGEGAQPGGFLLNRNPQAMSVGTYSFWNTDVVFGLDERRSTSAIADASITMSRDAEGGFSGTVGNATMEFAGWPKFDLDRMDFRLRDGVVQVQSGNMDLQRGEMTFIGDFPLASGDAFGSVAVRDVNLENLVTGVWKPLVDGIMSDGRFDVKMNPEDPDSLEVSGEFSLSLLRLRQVRFLQTLESLLTNSDYEMGMVSGVTGKLQVHHDHVVIDQLQMEVANGVLIQGGLKFTKEGAMEGRIRIGVPPERFGVKQPAIFQAGEGGLVWTMVTLSGRRGTVMDDLKDRIRKSEQMDQMQQRGNQPAVQRQVSPDALFEALTQPQSD